MANCVVCRQSGDRCYFSLLVWILFAIAAWVKLNTGKFARFRSNFRSSTIFAPCMCVCHLCLNFQLSALSRLSPSNALHIDKKKTYAWEREREERERNQQKLSPNACARPFRYCRTDPRAFWCDLRQLWYLLQFGLSFFFSQQIDGASRVHCGGSCTFSRLDSTVSIPHERKHSLAFVVNVDVCVCVCEIPCAQTATRTHSPAQGEYVSE